MKKNNKNRVLLNELSQSRSSDIKKAIEKCLRVRMTYNDEKGGKGKNERYILPVVYGRTLNGKLAIRAFQSAGSTKRGVPKYKLFLLKRIVSWSNGKKTFKSYEKELLDRGLNQYGDMHFSEIYAITPFATGFHNLSSENEPIDSEPIQKQDISPELNGKELETGPKKKPQIKPIKRKPANKPEKPIENDPNVDYFNNKVEAQPTEPVKKSDVQDNQPTEPQQEPQQQMDDITADNGYIKKTDIEPTKISRDNPLTKSFQDMMDRMSKRDKINRMSKPDKNGEEEDEDENNEDNNE